MDSDDAVSAKHGTPLTTGEQRFLDAHSGISDPSGSIEDGATLRSRSTAPKALSAGEVAETMGWSIGQVRSLIASGEIHASVDELTGVQQVPCWQFIDRRLIPHLAKVVPALELESESSLEGFFVHAEIEDDHVYGVAQWLLSGGDPQRVIDLQPSRPV